MARLKRTTSDRLERDIRSLIKLLEEFKKSDFEIDEGLISWLQVDIQSLKIAAEQMEEAYYTKES